jgi:hypothetical protein
VVDEEKAVEQMEKPQGDMLQCTVNILAECHGFETRYNGPSRCLGGIDLSSVCKATIVEASSVGLELAMYRLKSEWSGKGFSALNSCIRIPAPRGQGMVVEDTQCSTYGGSDILGLKIIGYCTANFMMLYLGYKLKLLARICRWNGCR